MKRLRLRLAIEQNNTQTIAERIVYIEDPTLPTKASELLDLIAYGLGENGYEISDCPLPSEWDLPGV